MDMWNLIKILIQNKLIYNYILYILYIMSCLFNSISKLLYNELKALNINNLRDLFTIIWK